MSILNESTKSLQTAVQNDEIIEISDEETCDEMRIAEIGNRMSVHDVLKPRGQFKSTPSTKLAQLAFERVMGKLCSKQSRPLIENSVWEEIQHIAELLRHDDDFVAYLDVLAIKIDPTNCFGAFYVAERLKLVELFDVAVQCICKYFSHFFKSRELVQLSCEQLAKVFASDELNAPTEELVFESIMFWVRHNPLKRRVHIPELLGLLRMPYITATYLYTHVRPVCVQNNCLSLIEMETDWLKFVPRKAQQWSLLVLFEEFYDPESDTSSDNNEEIQSDNNEEIQSDNSEESQSDNSEEMRNDNREEMQSNNSEESQNDNSEESESENSEESCHFTYQLRIMKFDASTKIWSIFGRLRPGRTNFSASIIHDLLIVVGADLPRYFDRVDGYDLRTGEVMILEQMPARRKCFEVAVLDGLLYAVSGCDPLDEFEDTVERYNPETDSWSEVAPIPTARCSMAVAVLDGLLYVFGGEDPNGLRLAVTECYDPRTNQWTERANMNIGRSWHGGAAAHGFIYAVGGLINDTRGNGLFIQTKTVERYDPRANKWTVICSLQRKAICVSCTLMGERLLALCSSSGYIHEYDFFTGSWNLLTKSTECKSEDAMQRMVAVKNLDTAKRRKK